jgi:hypothetical protein
MMAEPRLQQVGQGEETIKRFLPRAELDEKINVAVRARLVAQH